MSANLIVDLGGTAEFVPSITLGAVAGSGIAYAASGAIIGQSCDLINGNTACNVAVAGCPLFTSGQLRIQVQTSDTDVSGSYTDPTSGLAQLPGVFNSGGIIILNSGGLGSGTIGGGTSGQNMQSGFSIFTYFQRPTRYARANMLSGDFYGGTLFAGFVTQLKTTGSGGGTSQQPGSGKVSV